MNAFCRLTPELSRADRSNEGPVLRELLEVSTKPRYGVGLNDLLGAGEPEKNEIATLLPNTEAEQTGRAPHTHRRRAKRSHNTRLQERSPHRGEIVDRADTRTTLPPKQNVPTDIPKSIAKEANKPEASTTQQQNAFAAPNA